MDTPRDTSGSDGVRNRGWAATGSRREPWRASVSRPRSGLPAAKIAARSAPPSRVTAALSARSARRRRRPPLPPAACSAHAAFAHTQAPRPGRSRRASTRTAPPSATKRTSSRRGWRRRQPRHVRIGSVIGKRSLLPSGVTGRSRLGRAQRAVFRIGLGGRRCGVDHRLRRGRRGDLGHRLVGRVR